MRRFKPSVKATNPTQDGKRELDNATSVSALQQKADVSLLNLRYRYGPQADTNKSQNDSSQLSGIPRGLYPSGGVYF